MGGGGETMNRNEIVVMGLLTIGAVVMLGWMMLQASGLKGSELHPGHVRVQAER